MGALTEVVRAGKARYLGFSEWTAEQIQMALDLPGVEKFVSSQPQYSLLYREPEGEIFPLCAANGISQIVWSPLAQGVLTGKYRAGEQPPQDSRAAWEGDGLGDGPVRLTDEVIGRRRGLRPDRGRAGHHGCPSSRSRGCCASRTSPRRSSVRAAPRRWTTTPPRQG